MNLEDFELWHNVPNPALIHNGAFPLSNRNLLLFYQGKPVVKAARCAIELHPSGVPSIIGVEVLDVDENGQQRRNEDGSGKVIVFGLLPDATETRKREAEQRARAIAATREWWDALPEDAEERRKFRLLENGLFESIPEESAADKTTAALTALQRLGGGPEPTSGHSGPIGYSGGAEETPDGEDL